jgi:hypothetical protein
MRDKININMSNKMLYIPIDLKEQDLIHFIKQGINQKEKKYKVHSLEIKEDGNWHDGYIYSHFAYVEEIQSQLVSFELIAVTSKMLEIKDLYFTKCD